MQKQLLLTFLDVLETRNFRRTADRMDITQSSVSGRIRQLEAELGARLFERGRGGADPTPDARRFEAQCRSLLALWSQAVNDAATGAKYDGALRISVQFSLMRSLLRSWTQDIRQAMPNVTVRLELDYSVQIMRDIAAGHIDVGIVYAPQYLPDLVIEEVGSEEYVMVSTVADRLEGVRVEEYIRAGYTLSFETQHDANLPHLAHPPLVVGCEDLAMELLGIYGGATYVARSQADVMIAKGTGVRLVEDAPLIAQKVFCVVHSRRRNAPRLQQALRLLRKNSAVLR